MPRVDREERLAYHREYSRRYRQENKDKARATQREQWAKYRQEAIDALGGKCIRCGEEDRRVMQIDHIEGGGASDKRTRGSWQRLRAVPNEVERFQLLCANCHARKTYESGDHLPK